MVILRNSVTSQMFVFFVMFLSFYTIYLFNVCNTWNHTKVSTEFQTFLQMLRWPLTIWYQKNAHHNTLYHLFEELLNITNIPEAHWSCRLTHYHHIVSLIGGACLTMLWHIFDIYGLTMLWHIHLNCQLTHPGDTRGTLVVKEYYRCVLCQ